MSNTLQTLWAGTWDYRSYNNYTFAKEQAEIKKTNDKEALIFGQGTIIIEPSDKSNELRGSIGNPDRKSWNLEITGSINYGDPFTVRFQGKGEVFNKKLNKKFPWIYEYVGYLVNPWQNGVNQVPAFVGSVIRQIPHPGSDGTIHPAGVVASFYCVKNS